jgi:hypothetical protein
MLTAAQTLTLAHAYSAATGDSLYLVGIAACNNNKIFHRMARGLGCNTRSLERAGAFFLANWPEDAPWPVGIPGGPAQTGRSRKRTAATAA